MRRWAVAVLCVGLAACGGASTSERHAEYRRLARCFARIFESGAHSLPPSKLHAYEAGIERVRYEAYLAAEAAERTGGHPKWPPRPRGC
jgi:hypothetical protein